MTFGIFRKAAGLLALSFLAAAPMHMGAAQTGGGQAQPAQQPPAAGPQLDIPQNVDFVGTAREPNVSRATAIVNDEIITQTDIDQRLALFLASQNVQFSPEEAAQLRQQVLRNLIDETLQIQAAKDRKIELDRRDIDRYYERFAQQFGHTGRSFTEYLRTIGASERTVKRQIEGELAWTQIQRRLPNFSIGNEEVNRRIEQLRATRGAPEYRVAEIFMYANPDNAAQVRGRLTQLIQQIRSGGSFPAFARQYSEATTAAVGGDLGWLRGEQLPPEIAAAVQQMPVGSISEPIQLPDGFSVVVLADSRQVLTANPRDAELSLMQMSIALPPGTTEAVARERAAQLAQVTSTMGGCGGAQQAATRLGAELVTAEGRAVRQMPAVLQDPLLAMSVGQVTPPFGTTERISVLVLCGRDDPQAAAEPTFQSEEERLREERMGRQAQRLLRDLRRDAVIEYR